MNVTWNWSERERNILENLKDFVEIRKEFVGIQNAIEYLSIAYGRDAVANIWFVYHIDLYSRLIDVPLTPINKILW